jgi:hypothetical protein
VFISRNRVIPGKLDDFKRHYHDSIRSIEDGKPGTLVQLAYLSEDAAEVVILRLFPSPEALDLQLQGADERSKAAYRFIEPASIEVHGTPSSYAMEMMSKVAGSGIAVRIHPQFVGGFIRPGSGQPLG